MAKRGYYVAVKAIRVLDNNRKYTVIQTPDETLGPFQRMSEAVAHGEETFGAENFEIVLVK